MSTTVPARITMVRTGPWQNLEYGYDPSSILDALRLAGESSITDLAGFLGWPLNTVRKTLFQQLKAGAVARTGHRWRALSHRSSSQPSL